MRDSHCQPGTAARYVVVVVVTPSTASTPQKAIAEVYPYLVDRLKNAGITYQKIETDEAARTISFYLIDGPAKAGATMNDPVAYFEEALTTNAKLEFRETYRLRDPELVEVFTQLSATHERFRQMRLNKSYVLGSGAVLGVANEGIVPVLDSLLALPEVRRLFPKDIAFRWSRPMQGTKELYGIKTPDEGAVLTEKYIEHANGSFNEYTEEPVVSLRFNGQGAKLWAQMTTRAAENQNREIAIVFNDEVLSAPRVMSPITGGQSMLSGDFTLEEVSNLVLQLQAAALPHTLKIVKASAL